MLADKIPGAVITHLYKELVLPGKFSRTLHAKVLNRPLTSFQRFFSINDLRITGGAAGPKTVRWPDGEVKADLVVLCPPMVPAAGAEKLSGLLEADLDRSGFFEEAGERLDSARGKTKGIFLAGSCQSPGDIREAINQGMAAAGYVLSSLVAGRNLKISPVVARVTDERCSGCGVCRAACSFKAIDIVPENGKSRVNDVLCQGCGTCVAACPAGAMVGCHYSREQLLAELEGVLA
jgi:heterodisulfide reductase subunit A